MKKGQFTIHNRSKSHLKYCIPLQSMKILVSEFTKNDAGLVKLTYKNWSSDEHWNPHATEPTVYIFKIEGGRQNNFQLVCQS